MTTTPTSNAPATSTPATTTPATKTPRARKSTPPKTFTVATLARELKIDPKIARRRMRANLAQKNAIKTPAPVKNTARKNERWTFVDNAANRKLITSIIRAK